MKTPALLLLVALLSCAGCCTTDTRSTKRLDARFRERLSELGAVRQANAQIREIRFSSDRKGVLVFFDLPSDSKQSSELVLKDDGFQRYQGEWWQRSIDGKPVFGGVPITVDVAPK